MDFETGDHGMSSRIGALNVRDMQPKLLRR
jgi:hypothetical protein